ncbi:MULTISPECIES: hypothetical protein [Mycolicibacterium]|uniref:DUF4386 family protein n=3 Tax=Mycolicibacterium gilvum TaxID=1804 RepID=E6TNU2_MYCSR|nr:MULTISPECIES: hypothetical protein [Mycolicibacterium]ABP42721.1 conserved hypothetical protein [Mycolicibacterium gilvum PYR-GCK]ADT97259.1 hypothetical protein Mspyr1_05500 [Mycolicibacterium gilvum Spyr1]MBV5245279.1 hypothetical protein [Mycolicibacterium sp. PAM1]MCV7054174.1 hypothetical protein [Mycolicibacterium gilvum]STZ41364.1 Uncharacterised protein [Mycolicibacterium gilvum]
MTHPADRHLRRLTTPRAAAFAGVLFALLFGAALVLIRTELPGGGSAGMQWEDGSTHRLRIAIVLMPFAGIAFLWFLGVVRDGLGTLEDRFFSTVMIGSALVFLAMIFASTAVGAGLLAARQIAVPGTRSEVAAFGEGLLLALSNTYALRMAGVFMMSLATIWLRTRLMPTWLVVLTYVVSLTVLVGSDVSKWMTVLFPVWVLIVSVMMLARAGVIDRRGATRSPDTV